MRIVPAVIAAACVFAIAAPASRAQIVPFFGGVGTAFDPEISVVNSGDLLDAQVVVSNDLKYVTINARPSSSRLLALREFTFQRENNVPLGFVGGNGLLGRRGMMRIADLD